MNTKITFLIILGSFLVGCTTTPRVALRSVGETDAIAAKERIQGTQDLLLKQKLEDADKSFQDAFDKCVAQGTRFQSRIEKSSYLDLSVTTLGIVAGAIIVPALAAKGAAKSVIAAWGGVSGAANAYQFAENQNGLGPAQYAKVYTSMTTNMVIAMHSYQAAGEDVKKLRAAVGDLIVACQFPTSADIVAASEPMPPNAPKDIVFVADSTDSTKGTLTVIPPDAGALPVLDFVATITPSAGIDQADFRNPKQATIKVSKLTHGTEYKVVIRSKNGAGEGPPTIHKFTP